MPTEFNFDMVNPGIALAVLGYFGFIFKDIPSQLWSLVKQKYSVSIQVSSMNDYIYYLTINWMIQKFPQLRKHLQYIGWSTVESNMADGFYMFMLDKFTYASVSKSRINGTYDKIMWNVQCQIVGKNRDKYLEEYKEMIHLYMPDMHDHLCIDYFDSGCNYTQRFYNRKKAFDDIFIQDDLKDKIVKIIDNFLASKKYYDEHGITYKIGILLSGPPGSGKSSIAKAIASYVGWKIRYMGEKDKPDSTLSDYVIFFEDIDCITEESRDNGLRGSKRPKDRHPKFSELQEADAKGELHLWENTKDHLSMHSLLNYLDGIMSPSSCIFIATTNYPEKLDPALIRPGRFDYHFKIDLADRNMAEKMCDRFGTDCSILDDYEFPCSLSSIQSRIMFDKIDMDKK